MNSRKERLNYLYDIAPVDTMSVLERGIRHGSAMGCYGDGIDLEKECRGEDPNEWGDH